MNAPTVSKPAPAVSDISSPATDKPAVYIPQPEYTYTHTYTQRERKRGGYGKTFAVRTLIAAVMIAVLYFGKTNAGGAFNELCVRLAGLLG